MYHIYLTNLALHYELSGNIYHINVCHLQIFFTYTENKIVQIYYMKSLFEIKINIGSLF